MNAKEQPSIVSNEQTYNNKLTVVSTDGSWTQHACSNAPAPAENATMPTRWTTASAQSSLRE